MHRSRWLRSGSRERQISGVMVLEQSGYQIKGISPVRYSKQSVMLNFIPFVVGTSKTVGVDHYQRWRTIIRTATTIPVTMHSALEMRWRRVHRILPIHTARPRCLGSHLRQSRLSIFLTRYLSRPRSSHRIHRSNTIDLGRRLRMIGTLNCPKTWETPSHPISLTGCRNPWLRRTFCLLLPSTPSWIDTKLQEAQSWHQVQSVTPMGGLIKATEKANISCPMIQSVPLGTAAYEALQADTKRAGRTRQAGLPACWHNDTS